MKVSAKIGNDFSSKSFLHLTYVMACFPILTFGLRSVTLFLWFFFGLYCYWTNRNNETDVNFNKRQRFYLLLSVLPFIYLCITLFYSENILSGFKRLTQMLAFLIFPIIFYLNNSFFSKKQIQIATWCFAGSVIVLVFYQIISSLLNLDDLLASLSADEIKLNNLQNLNSIDEETVKGIKIRRFRNYINDLVDTHFTYQGLWISVVLFLLLKEVSVKLSKAKNAMLIITASVLFLWLFFLSTRMPIIVIFIAFFLTYYLNHKFKLKTFLLFISSTFLLLFISYKTIIPIQVRVNEIFRTKFDLPTKGNDIQNYNSVNVRNGIYFCSLDVIKRHLLFGVGVGDAQDQLNECYKHKLGSKIYTWQDYNTHNQFLFFLLASGTGGFFLFLALMFLHLRESIRAKEKVYFYFIIAVCFISMTETILVRSDGVLFFSLFANLFLFNRKEN